MGKLTELANILKTNEDFIVEILDTGILIKNKVDEGQIVPTDLVNFVKIYEKEPSVSPKGNGYVINTTTFSAESFMMLLMSVFAAQYSFKVTGDYQVVATPKGKEGVREELENEEIDFEQLAELIDEDGLDIEIHEDGLKVECPNKTEIAEKIEEINPKLNIEITQEAILVTGE